MEGDKPQDLLSQWSEPLTTTRKSPLLAISLGGGEEWRQEVTTPPPLDKAVTMSYAAVLQLCGTLFN